MPGRAPPGYVTSFRGELIRVPLYLNHHWSSVLLSEVSNHTVTNDCLDSINLLIDELIWIIIQSVAFYQQPNCLSPVFGSPIYPIVRPPSEQAQFIRLPFHPSLLKTHGISRVLPNSIGRDSILEAEIALIAYDQRLRSLEPVNSRRRSVSGQQQTPMSLEDLYHQLQIECQVLSPYGSDFESSARNHSYQNLARSLPAPTRTRSGVKSSDIRSPRRPGRNERLMAPTGLVDHTIPILLDHNAFELELQLMSEQGMPGMPRPYSAPQAGPCLATTVMDPRSMIYLVGLIQSVSAYLLKGSIRALERSSDQSAVHAWHLVDFISEDDHVTGFCRLFEQMNVKKYIDIVCHPPLPDLMKPLLQQEEHDQGDQLVESYRLLPSSRIVKYRPSPGMLASPSYPMIIQPAPMSTSALISSTSGCDVAVELRARASAPSLRPSGLKLPDGSQPLPSGRSLRSMIPLPVSPSSSSIIGSPLRSPIPLSKNQSKTSSVVPPSQSITSLNDASRQGAASARGTVLQEGAIKGASFISNLEISTQPHPSNQASSTALHSAPVLCAYSPSNLNSLSQSSLTPETFNNHNQSIPEPRKPRDVNFQSADSGSSSIASYSCSSASSSISSASVYPKSGTIPVATSKPSYQPLAAPENRKAAVRRSRSWTTLSQSLLYPESDNPNSQTSVKLNEVKNNLKSLMKTYLTYFLDKTSWNSCRSV
ncbi:hypothetical protein BY996DRAFT_6901032 [Phakopsora pachyrhizi]|nr:hypothetical protein BY996DRAFT_6901032 [Phakopsora pachyrhizi]